MSQLPVPDSAYLQAKDFNATPRKMVVVKDPELKEAAQFGDVTTGMSYFYSFQNEEGMDMEFQNNSKRLAKAWNGADPKVGDIVAITRTGDGMATQYSVEVVKK